MDRVVRDRRRAQLERTRLPQDRKSTRLNSSHRTTSYAHGSHAFPTRRSSDLIVLQLRVAELAQEGELVAASVPKLSEGWLRRLSHGRPGRELLQPRRDGSRCA